MDLRLLSATSPVSAGGDLADRLTKPLQKAEALGHGFSAELEVDDDGMMVDTRGLFRRVA